MARRTLETKKGGLTGRSIRDGTITPNKFSLELAQGSYVYEPCNYTPHAVKSDGYSPPTGATAALNFLEWRGVNALYYMLGAGQTLLAPFQDSTLGGLTFALDDVAAEGHQGVWGAIQTAKNPFAVTIGTTRNSFVRATWQAGTVANVAELAIGWRKAESMQALFDDYDELAALNVQAGIVNRETILNNAATVTVDTTKRATDATAFTLEVRLIGRYARFYFNNLEVSSGAKYRFDVGEVLVPFWFFLHGGGASALNLMDFEIGPLSAINRDPERR